MIGAILRGTGHTLIAMPFLIIPMGLYIVARQFGQGDAMLYGGALPSGAYFGLTAGGSLIFIGIACLILEVMKATATGVRSLVDQTLSVFLLGVCGVAFLLFPAFGTLDWLVLCTLQLADVLLGAMVGIRTARRDIGLSN